MNIPFLRFDNPYINEKISKALNNPYLDETTVKLELLLPNLTEKEQDALFDDEGNLNYKKFESLCKKIQCELL